MWERKCKKCREIQKESKENLRNVGIKWEREREETSTK